jgi:polyisoprenoid-binding protein YceI
LKDRLKGAGTSLALPWRVPKAHPEEISMKTSPAQRSVVCAFPLVLTAALAPSPALGASRPIDASRSTMTVRVGKSGLFSVFGDNHEIRAPIASGKVDDGPQPSVELTIDAKGMKVLDPKLASEKRAEVQKKMLGPDVLDVERYGEIRFRSTSLKPAGSEGRWRVEGVLELHGTSSPVAFDVTVADGRVQGSAPVSQKAFGIPPISAAGGTIKVRDEVRIEFDVFLEPAAP